MCGVILLQIVDIYVKTKRIKDTTLTQALP